MSVSSSSIAFFHPSVKAHGRVVVAKEATTPLTNHSAKAPGARCFGCADQLRDPCHVNASVEAVECVDAGSAVAYGLEASNQPKVAFVVGVVHTRSEGGIRHDLAEVVRGQFCTPCRKSCYVRRTVLDSLEVQSRVRICRVDDRRWWWRHGAPPAPPCSLACVPTDRAFPFLTHWPSHPYR